MDLTNPTPPLGWDNDERKSLRQRGPVDMISMLALIHHLSIGSNIPFEFVAEYTARLCTWLVIEFVPKDDPMVRQLMRLRKDVFPSYTQKDFEHAFQQKFKLMQRVRIAHSKRIMYLFKNQTHIV